MLQLIYSLTAGDHCPPIIDDQIDRFIQKLKFYFEDLLWLSRTSSFEAARVAYDDYAALSVPERYAFFLSPAVFAEILNQRAVGTPDLRILSKFCISETAVAAAPPQAIQSGDHQWWTPLFSRAHHVTGEAGKVYTAPVLGGSVTIDVSSPFCRRCDMSSPVFFGEFVGLSEEETARVVSKLSVAFSEVEAIAPIFARIIQNYTRVVCVRKRPGAPPSSEQLSNEIGAIRLLNVQDPVYTHEQLMDDLIHESVHNLLSTYEFLEHPFQIVGRNQDQDVRAVSPWSMRALRVLPFLHAPFVYFALLHFSMKRLETSNLSDEQRYQAIRRRNRYASGFLMPGVLSDYVRQLADVDPRTLHAMDQMQQMVRRRFSPTTVHAKQRSFS